MNYLGIDPGASGALALLHLKPDAAGRVDSFLQVEDMPTLEINGKRRIDLYKLAGILEMWAGLYVIERAVIENVNAMPKQGVASSFYFGFAAGAAQMAVAGRAIPMVLVVPQVWKKVYGLRGGPENKDASRAAASRLFPGAAHYWERKKDDGRAEAALLAHYGSKLQ